MSNKSADNLIKSKIHSLITKLDYEQRILFLLKNMGPQRFTDFEKISNMSKSTLSKYLNKLLDQDLIKKKIHEDKKPRYYITNKGIEEINKKFFNQEDNLLYYDKLRDITLKLDDLIKFYKKISIEDSIIFKIVGIISKIGDKFFSIDQNEDLFLTMFYIFLNSVTTKEYKFELKEFCKHYNIKKLRIEFYIDKIMSSNLGFYMFQRMEDMFFFHEKDIVGTMTLHLINETLQDILIKMNLSGLKSILDLDAIAEKISGELIKMDLIWDADPSKGIIGIKEPFEMLIEKILIKNALDMGFSKTFLMDLALQSEKLARSKGGLNSLINIIEGSERYEDLNVVAINEDINQFFDELIEKVRGFCPKCGKTMLESDIVNKCPRCGIEFKPEQLIQDISTASKVSMMFKKKLELEDSEIECPNPNCHYYVKLSWGECPNCGTSLTKQE